MSRILQLERSFVMAPTIFEIIVYAILGTLALAGILTSIFVYIYSESRSYRNNRIHPERYGSIDTHYWC